MELLSSWLVLSLITLITIVCILKWKNSFISSGFNLPPSPPSLPIIGNLHHLFAKTILHQTLWKLSQKYGPIMLLRMGSQSFVIISSSELAVEALRTYDHILCNRPYTNSMKRLTFNYTDVAFSPYDDHWKKINNIFITEFLGSKRSKMFKKVQDKELKKLFDSLSSNAVVDLDKKIIDLVTDIVCKVTVGKSYREGTFRGSTMREMLDEMVLLFAGSFADIFPKYGWILNDLSGWSRRLDKHIAKFDAWLEMILDEHVDHTSEDDKDMIDGCRSSVTRDEMKSLLSNMFNGAIDTTGESMVWAMAELVKNPRVMHKLQDEIRRCIGKKSSVDESDIANMKYLKLVIKEILRMHAPPAILLIRECVSHIQIGGYDILPGTRVLINSWAIGRDPRILIENSNEFYPERFENLVVDQFKMTPFGGGRRSCPGYNFANSSLKIMLANFLYWFDWKLPDGMTNQDLKMEEKGNLLVSRKGPLRLVPITHYVTSITEFKEAIVDSCLSETIGKPLRGSHL